MFVGTVTASMTWIVMPRLARLLEPWLYAPPR
jgi:antibiotic biosynthesis monooxygenase (ABM) superfamily enzyme